MKKQLLPIIFIAGTVILWLIFYPKLPMEIPIHWNASGEADGFAPKLNAMLMSIGIMVFVYLITALVPFIDPKKENYKNFSNGLGIINFSILMVFFTVNVLMILSGLGSDIDTGMVIRIVIGAVFIVIGNYMPQIKPNYFMGIKTPWALNDDANWKKTHRFGGKAFIIGGVIFMISTLLPDGLTEKIVMPAILIVILSPMAYSYWIFRKQAKGL